MSLPAIKTETKSETIMAKFWPVFLIGSAWLWLFWPMMIGEAVCGFRDSTYLYYPLFKWIDAQWAAGEIPLWNPYCNYGMPVVGDGTSSVFYPGKAVFFCRFLSYPARYGIYLAIHVPIAAAGTYWFARTLRANRAGATLAAFSFAFGGSVLFQATNVIYLVSAAWLPFAVCSVWKMFKTGQIRWAIAAGTCCALMILGGDPQMVYHVGLISVATIIGGFIRRQQRRLRTRSEIRSSATGWITFRAVPLLTVMVVVTTLLAAIQLLPTYTWSKLSDRTNPKVPANIYGTFFNPRGYIESEDVRSLLSEPIMTIEHSYQFSQPPWSISELFWPNISGKPFPLNQRWTSSLPGADRVWVPSLYMGLLPIVLALTGIRFWGRSRKRIWLSWLTLFFLVASFGWYGPVWLANEFIPINQQNPELGSQVGGLYWLMNMVLPKYFAFRYPAKLFLVASLGISLLAGVGLRPIRLKFTWVASLVMTALSGLGVFMFQGWGASRLNKLLFNDMLFGPFDGKGAVNATYESLFQALIVGAIVAAVCLLIRFLNFNRNRTVPSLLIILLVISTGIEIVIANAWLLAPVSSQVFEARTLVSERIAELNKQTDSVAPVRIYRSPFDVFEPQEWTDESSKNRLAEIVDWQRETLYPKQHLGRKVVLMGSFCSVWPEGYEQNVNDWEFQRASRSNQNSWIKRKNIRSFHAVFEPSGKSRLGMEWFMPDSAHDSTCPVGWVFDYSPLGLTRNLWQVTDNDSQFDGGRGPNCDIVSFENNRFVARVSTDRPKVLSFKTVGVSGWKVGVKNVGLGEEEFAYSETLKLIPMSERRNRNSFRGPNDGLLLPFSQAGEYEVEFIYSPAELWIGMWISGISWFLLIVGAVIYFRKRTDGNRRLSE